MGAMMETKIYALFDPRSGLVRYVGKTVERERIRFNAHVRSAKAGGADYRDKWIRSLLEDGLLPEMEVIEIVPAGSDWQERERYWIAAFRRCLGKMLTNVTMGGEGVIGLPRTQAWSDRIGSAQRGKKRRPLSPEHRRAIAIGNTGKSSPKSAEQRKKLSMALAGRKTGAPSEETKQKISASLLGRSKSPLTPEQLAKWRKAQIRGEGHHQAKLNEQSVRAIRSEPTGGKALADKYGVSYSTIKMIRRREIWRHI